MSGIGQVTRQVALPSARIFIPAVYALSVLSTSAALIVGWFIDTDHRDVTEMILVPALGTTALLLVLGVGSALRRAGNTKVGAITFGVLAWLSIIFFWAGVPGLLGAGATWQAGLLSGDPPQRGSARIAGVAGLFAAILNCAVSTIGSLLVVATSNFGHV